MSDFSLIPAALTARNRAFFVAAIAFALLLATSCSTRRAPSLTAASLKYRPIRIATNIQSQPRGFGWSRDGKTLAFMKKGAVSFYDPGSAQTKSLLLDGAHSLTWSASDSLLVLAYENGKNVLCTIDRESLEITRSFIDEGSEAVYAGNDDRRLFILSRRSSRYLYGTEIALRVSSYDKNADAPIILHALPKLWIYPKNKSDQRVLLSWIHAGLNPIDNSLLIIEQRKPPVIAAYSRVLMIDTVSGEITEISDKKNDTTYTSAGWSPDGKMVALTKGNGRLEIRDLRAKKVILDRPVAGAYPTWNPQNDRVYIGGRLVSLDGKASEELLSNAAESIAAWSPDGGTLAVSASGALWLFRDPGAASNRTGETGNRILLHKILLLQDLFRDGLIDLREYQERKIILLYGTEGD